MPLGCRDCNNLTSGNCGKHRAYVRFGGRRPFTCPVCAGTGKTFRPPYAIDARYGCSSGGAVYDCHACEGTGIVWG
jgi:hypothetical protein